MKISAQNITFKAIIPKAKTSVQNKQTGEFESAVFCEVDCKNKNDYKTFAKLEDWEYGPCLKKSAQWKYENQKTNKADSRQHFILKKENGEILSICRTSEKSGKILVDFLESKPESNYRFAGQMILSNIAKEAIKNGYNSIIIPAPVIGSFKFYEGACGFKEKDGILTMEDQDLYTFSQRAPKQK